MKIDCIEFVEKIRNDHDLSTSANLHIIQVGDNDASNLYINSKVKEASKWNINTTIKKFDEDTTTEYLVSYIKSLNESKNVDGIIIQLPLPRHIDETIVLDAINPLKNVDGFIQYGKKSKYFDPCTPKGIITLLESLTNLDGKFVTLIGRGKTVGEPLRDMLLAKNCTLCIAHSHTKKRDLEKLLLHSDIVISAVGKPNLFNISNLKNNVIVIDAGISRVNDKQIGDFDHNLLEYWDDLVYYTPWVNGVGKLTVAMLMVNTRKAKVLNS